MHDQFNKPALFVETDHGNKSYECTNNEQAVMVMNRLGTSGCAGFNIWRTFGSYTPELDELVRVSDFMNDAFVTHTFDVGNGAWEHQASLWKIKVSNDDGAKEKSELRELECIVSANKTKGFGTLYNRQFNVHNYADANFLTSSVETTNCNLGPSDPATNVLVGYLFSEGWEQKSIEWKKRKN